MEGGCGKSWEETKGEGEEAQQAGYTRPRYSPDGRLRTSSDRQRRGFQGNLADTCTHIFSICQFSLEGEIICSLTPVLLINEGNRGGFCLV